jgi:hypothetical protein
MGNYVSIEQKKKRQTDNINEWANNTFSEINIFEYPNIEFVQLNQKELLDLSSQGTYKEILEYDKTARLNFRERGEFYEDIRVLALNSRGDADTPKLDIRDHWYNIVYCLNTKVDCSYTKPVSRIYHILQNKHDTWKNIIAEAGVEFVETGNVSANLETWNRVTHGTNIKELRKVVTVGNIQCFVSKTDDVSRSKKYVRELFKELMNGTLLKSKPNMFYVAATSGIEPDEFVSSDVQIYEWVESTDGCTVAAKRVCVINKVPLWLIPKQERGPKNGDREVIESLVKREKGEGKIKISYITTNTRDWDNVKLIRFNTSIDDTELTRQFTDELNQNRWEKFLFYEKELEGRELLGDSSKVLLQCSVPIMLALISSRVSTPENKIFLARNTRLVAETKMHSRICHIRKISNNVYTKEKNTSFTRVVYLSSVGGTWNSEIWN